VHSGIHPIVQKHIGYSPDFALATLQNFNGLTGMAALLAAELSGDQQQVLRILNAQYALLDCLPPANPIPAPPLEPHSDALG
jgi:hypothetical protein